MNYITCKMVEYAIHQSEPKRIFGIFQNFRMVVLCNERYHMRKWYPHLCEIWIYIFSTIIIAEDKNNSKPKFQRVVCKMYYCMYFNRNSLQ